MPACVRLLLVNLYYTLMMSFYWAETGFRGGGN